MMQAPVKTQLLEGGERPGRFLIGEAAGALHAVQ
jgi:hypothetical protein